MHPAKTKDSRAAPTAKPIVTWKVAPDGISQPPALTVSWARMTPARALAKDVPSDRISLLKPLAASDCDAGIAPIMKCGQSAVCQADTRADHQRDQDPDPDGDERLCTDEVAGCDHRETQHQCRHRSLATVLCEFDHILHNWRQQIGHTECADVTRERAPKNVTYCR
ncbi:hypothetical protein [Rhodococcus sp. NPDC006774]|uniref:hypothetical protein n=1 Tax=Rhodococcus sp. NPDC006774 TaxID=3157186 RepID=UPI0033C0288C